MFCPLVDAKCVLIFPLTQEPMQKYHCVLTPADFQLPLFCTISARRFCPSLFYVRSKHFYWSPLPRLNIDFDSSSVYLTTSSMPSKPTHLPIIATRSPSTPSPKPIRGRASPVPSIARPKSPHLRTTEEPPEPPADPATCPIKPGKETTIEVNKDKMGLGLSIVGGSDTLLVSWLYNIMFNPV